MVALFVQKTPEDAQIDTGQRSQSRTLKILAISDVAPLQVLASAAPSGMFKPPGSLPGLYLTTKSESRKVGKAIQKLESHWEARAGSEMHGPNQERKRSECVTGGAEIDITREDLTASSKKLCGSAGLESTSQASGPVHESLKGALTALPPRDSESTDASLILDNERLREENIELRRQNNLSFYRNKALASQLSVVQGQREAMDIGSKQTPHATRPCTATQEKPDSCQDYTNPNFLTTQTTSASVLAHSLEVFALASSRGIRSVIPETIVVSQKPTYLLNHPYEPSEFFLGEILWAPNCSPALNPNAEASTDPKYGDFAGFTVPGCIRLGIVVRINSEENYLVVWIWSAGGHGPNVTNKKRKAVFRVVPQADFEEHRGAIGHKNEALVAIAHEGQPNIMQGSYADISDFSPISYRLKIKRAGMLAAHDVRRFLEAFDQFIAPPHVEEEAFVTI